MARATVLGLLLLPALASGQTRPLLTEPAVTAPRGTTVLETGFDIIASEPSYLTGVRRARWDGPLLRLVHSPSDEVELDFEWVGRVGVLGEAGRGPVSSSDWGDVALRAKWRIAGGQRAGPTLGARFGVFLPETSFDDKQFRPLGLGPNTLRVFAEGLFSHARGRMRLHANAGIFLFDEVYRPHDQRDFLSYGLAVERQVTPLFTVLAEVAGRAGDGTPGADARSEARLGLRAARRRLCWDAALRRGLGAHDGTWGATAGLSWSLRRTSE